MIILYGCSAPKTCSMVSLESTGSYLSSLLDDSVVQQLMATEISSDVTTVILFETLNHLVNRKQPPVLALEAFWSRRQLMTELADAYVGALRELALQAFPGGARVSQNIYAGCPEHETLFEVHSKTASFLKEGTGCGAWLLRWPIDNLYPPIHLFHARTDPVEPSATTSPSLSSPDAPG
ncbi:unnamed protein product [Schistocephalus solidus]|uniref:Uncharacterized protein n=1 Tax=Schistocephalus solidus TaxID=70667 RepID=A0A183TBL8_SCHSO|nr:unnamed protein product [Schistocephalus solidus]